MNEMHCEYHPWVTEHSPCSLCQEELEKRNYQSDKLRTLESELQSLRENLKTIEWSSVSGYDICPVCDGDRKHNEDCWLGKAVK